MAKTQQNNNKQDKKVEDFFVGFENTISDVQSVYKQLYLHSKDVNPFPLEVILKMALSHYRDYLFLQLIARKENERQGNINVKVAV